jgi:hypothetical protein
MTVYQDDRDRDQRETMLWAVAATDPAMSGWGGAKGGRSVCAWACSFDDLTKCEQWVRARGDMHRVRVVLLADWRPRAAHVHVYVWEPNR